MLKNNPDSKKEIFKGPLARGRFYHKNRGSHMNRLNAMLNAIPTDSFNGIGEIEPEELSDYAFTRTMRTIIGTSEDLRKAVYTVMVNMFLDLPSNIVGIRKEYSGRERGYIRRQLGVFQEALSVQEVVFDPNYNDFIGKFQNKDIYRINSLDELLKSNLWNSDIESSYHIVHIENPSYVIPQSEYAAAKVASDIVEAMYGIKKGGLEGYLSEIGIIETESKQLGEEFEKFVDYVISQRDGVDKQLYQELLPKISEKYFDENLEASDKLKEVVRRCIEFTEFEEKFEDAVQDEIKKFPDEIGIITKIAGNTPILILGSSKVKDIPGYRLVGAYQSNSLYQIVTDPVNNLIEPTKRILGTSENLGIGL